MRPLRVFLCHASQDKPAVRELYNALKAEGWIDPWLDKAKILPGQDWELVIEKAVDDSDVVVVCLSGQSVTKEGFVQREIRYAYDIALEKPEETIFLIPLRLDDCNVPRKLRSLHWVDYFGVEKENAYTDLLEALKLRYNQKLNLEAEETERRQAEEKANREAEEHTRRLAAEQSAREKAIQAAKEKADRESAEKAASEKKERDAREKAARDARRKKQQEVVGDIISFLSSKSRTFAISGLVIVGLLFVGFGGNYLLNNLPAMKTIAISSSETSALPTTPPMLTQPTLGIGSTMIGEDGMTLLYVPEGKFVMGSGDGEADEKPIHTVYLDAFWIDQTEVTNAMYAKCVDAGECSSPSDVSHYDNLSYINHPVVYVDWGQAMVYCAWAGRRLPTEAEWEKSARGTDAQMFPWGNESPNSNFLNYNGNIYDTTEVGKYSDGASAYGALDMAGNVWEWVSDWYDENYYANSPEFNPVRLSFLTGYYRVFRGGSWIDVGLSVRAANRNGVSPTLSTNSTGFRCARSP